MTTRTTALIASLILAPALAVTSLAQAMPQTGSKSDKGSATQGQPYAPQDPYRDKRALPDANANDTAAQEALLRARGEAYRRAPDEAQVEEELRTTSALNHEIASQNDLAEDAEIAAQLEYEDAMAAHRDELRAIRDQTRAQAEAARAAQEQYDRDYEAWRQRVRLCQDGVRSACDTPR